MEVIQEGEGNGVSMITRFKFPSGLEIIGLATKNYYGGEWDTGSSWNYVVLADKPFLLDTGRTGMGKKLLQMIETAGLSVDDLECIVISHGHEDHDGGLYELVQSTGLKVKVQSPYERLMRFFPDKAPEDVRSDFPASCWHCYMPDSFPDKYCIDYHRERSKLKVEEIVNGNCGLGESIRTYHMPGHCPDSLAMLLGDEAILVGDTVLPEITPLPTREAFFYQVSEILRPEYTSADALYGLRAYIRSIRKLKEIGKKFPDILVLPGHRLFYNDRWNELDLQERVDEIIEHHVKRCAEILEIVKQGAKPVREIAEEYFPSRLLKGTGIFPAENEIYSHCELLGVAEDVVLTEDNKFVASGSTNFESVIRSLEP